MEGKVVFPLHSPCSYTSRLPVELFYRHSEGYRPEKTANAEGSPSSASSRGLRKVSAPVCGAPANTDPRPARGWSPLHPMQPDQKRSDAFSRARKGINLQAAGWLRDLGSSSRFRNGEVVAVKFGG